MNTEKEVLNKHTYLFFELKQISDKIKADKKLKFNEILIKQRGIF